MTDRAPPSRLPNRLPRSVRRVRWVQWALAVAVCGWLAWWWSGREAEQKTVDNLTIQMREVEIEANMVAAHISDRVSQAQSVATILANDPGVVAALQKLGPRVLPSDLPLEASRARWAADADLAVLSDRFQRVLPRFRLKVLWLSNAAGDVVAESHAPDMPEVLGVNFSGRAYFKAAQQGQPGHQFAVGRLSNMMGLYLSAPVMRDGVFQGMVGTSLGIGEFAPLLQEVVAFATDDQGVVVLGPDPSWNLKLHPQATVMNLTEGERLARYKRTEFESLGLVPVGSEAGLPLYELPQLPGPVLLSSRPVLGGFLTLHNIRSQARLLEEMRSDQLWSFVALAVSGTFALTLVGGLGLFAEVSRRQARSLAKLNARLSRLANTDALTGATSRRHFLQLMALELVRSQRHGLDLCVLSLDLDHFKHVNDTHGHAAGDAVLKHFANLIRGALRQTDVFGRLGGEEFSILLAQTTAQGGLQMAERIRAAVASNPVVWEGVPIPVTVSIGGTHWRSLDLPTVDHLLATSDQVLYQAKHQGRNRVVWQSVAEQALTAASDAH